VQLSEDTRALLSAGAVGVEISFLLTPLELVRIQGQNKGKGGIIAASRHVAVTARCAKLQSSQKELI
jgi:hypothetical protein